jgi:hypothetical protein
MEVEGREGGRDAGWTIRKNGEVIQDERNGTEENRTGDGKE